MAELIIGRDLDAVPRARRFATSVLTDLPDEVVADVQLIVTELVTNAALHGEPPIVVRVEQPGSCVSVEVEDAGRTLPIQVVQREDAMTGRGLALVSALAEGWGVRPRQGGKVVWAELPLEREEDHPSEFDMDVDAILAAWSDDEEEDPPRHTVRLGAVPTELLLNAKAHIDNVVRELTLVNQGGEGPGLPPALAGLVKTVQDDFAEARSEIKRQAVAASSRGDALTNLELHLPVESADAGMRYLAALDAADRFAKQENFLTLAAPTSHHIFRRWYVHSLVDQLRALDRGETPPEAVPFAVVLAKELDRDD